jgi:hypothetical protein
MKCYRVIVVSWLQDLFVEKITVTAYAQEHVLKAGLRIKELKLEEIPLFATQ